MFATTPSRRLGRALALAGTVGGLALLSAAPASAAYTFCNGCTLEAGGVIASGLTFKVQSVYAHNLGSADRLVGVAITGGGTYQGTNTAYHEWNSLIYVQAGAHGDPNYRVHMNAHLSAPGA